MKAQTDAIAGISFDKTGRPGISNLLSVMSAVTDTPIDRLVEQYAVICVQHTSKKSNSGSNASGCW